MTDKQSEKPVRRQWQWLIAVVAVAALGFAAAPLMSSTLRDLPWALHHLSPRWLLLCALAQGGVYVCLGEILAVSLGALGHRNVPRRSLLPTGAAFLLANRAIPGPAVAGLAVLVHRLKREQVPAQAGQAVAAAFYAADYAGFLLLGVLALPFLAVNNHLAGLHPRLLLASLTIILASAGGLVIAYRAPGFLESAAAPLGRAGAILRRRRASAQEGADRAAAAITAFRTRTAALTAHPGRLTLLCGWALLMHICEVATLALAVRAFSGAVPFSSAVIGYVAGNLGAIVSVLPGGAGLYEGGMITALHTIGGLPVSLALTATLLYRLLSLWLPMPFALLTVRQAWTQKQS